MTVVAYETEYRAQLSSRTAGFMPCLMKALVAGIITAASLAAGFSIAMDLGSGSVYPETALLVFVMVGVGALFLSIVLLGPVAAAVARPFYRRGVRTTDTYVGLGAATAAALPLVMTLITIMTGAPAIDVLGVAVIGTAWFGISGAVGGLFFARSARNYDLKDIRHAAEHF
jgi:hypothetical protein